MIIIDYSFRNHISTISSDAKNMAADVRNFVLSIVQKHGGLGEAEALQYVKKMESQKRYSADVWS